MLNDEIMQAIAKYESDVIDYVFTENEAAVVDHDAVTAGVRINGQTAASQFDDDTLDVIVEEVHRSLKTRAASSEPVDFLPVGVDYVDKSGERQTARRELLVPKEWNAGGDEKNENNQV